MSRVLRHVDYTIAWIAILPIEVEAALVALDKRHDGHFESVRSDEHTYIGGEIAGHNVVIAKLPVGHDYGIGAAAALVNQVKTRFENLWFALLVGVAAGLPNLSTIDAARRRDIRLGDVLVCVPDQSSTGVVHYDCGRDTDLGFETNGRQAEPPAIVRSAIGDIQLTRKPFGAGNNLALLLEEFYKSADNDEFKYPGQDQDELFERRADAASPLRFDKLVHRERRDDSERTRVWLGRIGSGNTLMRNPQRRDELRDRYNLIGLEMEAAGVMNTVPTGVVRGVCDYGDGHKTKTWQPYAAAVAAVYAKALLLGIRPKPLLLNDSMSPTAEVQSFAFSLNLSEAPIIEDELFIGRATELQEMEKVLQPGSAPPKHRRLILGGMGGIGKTQLAIAYAKRHGCVYDSIFWLNAASETVLKHSMRQVARRVLDVEQYRRLDDDDQVLHHVTRWLLIAENTRWLIILDNYDDPDVYDIGKYCPYGAHGSVIVTTRLPNQVQGQHVLIRPLEDIEQSLDILATRSGRAHVATDPYALRLVQRMQGFPLALATVGAYLKHSSWTFQEYLQTYEKQFNVDHHVPFHLPEYRSRTLYTTWDLTYVRLAAAHPVAARLLRSFAFFDNQHLQYDLFRVTNDHSTVRKVAKKRSGFRSLFRSPEVEEPVQWIPRMAVDEFESAMRVLTEFCFVEVRSAQKEYSIHSCVHDWALSSLDNSSQSGGYWFAFDRIADLVNDIASGDYALAKYSVITPHAVRLADSSFDTLFPGISHKRLNSAHEIALFLRRRNKFDAAEQMYTRTLAGYERTLGPEHSLTLDTISGIGRVYRGQGKLEEAEQMYTRALAGHEKTLGPEHPSTLDTIHNLGMLYYDQGKLEEAEQILIRALAGYERTLGPEHSSTLHTINCIGLLYRDQGKLEEAEQILIRALAGYEKTLGPEHSSTLHTMNYIGMLYHQQGKLEEAKQMYIRAQAGKEKALGPEHSSTLDTMNILGILYRDQGKLEEAEQMYTQALVGYKKGTGQESPRALQCMLCYANLLIAKHEVKEARQLYEQIIGTCAKCLAGTTSRSQSIANTYAKAMSNVIRMCGDNNDSVHGQSYLISLVEYFCDQGKANAVVTRCLMTVLLYLHDDATAQQVLLCYTTHRKSKALDLGGVCCKGCYRRLNIDTGINICRQCVASDFCDICMTTRFTETYPPYKCQHEQLYNYADALRQASRASEAYDATKVNVDAWIDKLKQQYQVRVE